jgi:ATP-dependent helicase/nuclease subunit B
VRDPYAIYARDILGLRQMDRPDASVEAIARGNAVHKAVERLVLLHPYDLPEDGEQVIEALILEELQNHGFTGHIMARETPLARNAARWLAGFERARRARGVEFLIEQTGAITIPAAGGDFTLSAKADRIELAAHGAAIMDFKTGAAPTKKEMLAGWSPQLTLTGAILADGGFEKSPAVEATELTYVRVTGRRTPGEEICRASGEEAQYLCRRALEGLSARIARFDDQATPYVSWAAPQFQGKYGGDYDHLARVWEWHVAGAESDDAGGGE